MWILGRLYPLKERPISSRLGPCPGQNLFTLPVLSNMCGLHMKIAGSSFRAESMILIKSHLGIVHTCDKTQVPSKDGLSCGCFIMLLSCKNASAWAGDHYLIFESPPAIRTFCSRYDSPEYWPWWLKIQESTHALGLVCQASRNWGHSIIEFNMPRHFAYWQADQ